MRMDSGFSCLLRKADTLKRISFDLANHDYMTRSGRMAFQFDQAIHGIWRMAKTENAALAELYTSTPAVCDALLMLPQENVLIEFKNGRMPKKTVVNIHQKIHDSVQVYAHLTGRTVAENCGHLVFILVYNAEKNVSPDCCYEPEILPDTAIAEFCNERIYCGLEQYRGRYFREVHTYSVQEFEAWMQTLPPVPEKQPDFRKLFPENPLVTADAVFRK